MSTQVRGQLMKLPQLAYALYLDESCSRTGGGTRCAILLWLFVYAVVDDAKVWMRRRCKQPARVALSTREMPISARGAQSGLSQSLCESTLPEPGWPSEEQRRRQS